MIVKEFIRNGRAPIPKKAITSQIMSTIRAKNTTPEKLLRKALFEKHLIGYRLHCKILPGRPDICFIRNKLAIFVHGCFWHRCPLCNPSLPKTHKTFWREKFRRNVKRDKEKIQELKKAHWKVLVIWECQIKSNRNKIVNLIEKKLS